MKRILNIKSQLCNTRLIKTQSGKSVCYHKLCSIILVAFMLMYSSTVLTPTLVYSTAEDRKQFHGELRESARNGLPTNYWSFHNYVGDASLRINISGVDPVSSTSEIFGPLLTGEELFIRDPAHFFPESERIRVIVTADPASSAENIEAEIFNVVGIIPPGNVATEDNQGVVLDQEFISSASSLSILFKTRV